MGGMKFTPIIILLALGFFLFGSGDSHEHDAAAPFIASVESPLEVDSRELGISLGDDGDVLTTVGSSVAWEAPMLDVLPDCSDGQPSLMWRESAFRCTATETNEDWGASDTIDATILSGYIKEFYDNGGTSLSRQGDFRILSSLQSILTLIDSDDDSLASLLLVPGKVWVISPNWTKWIDGYSFNLVDSAGIAIGAITIERNYIDINGVPYDIAYADVTGTIDTVGDTAYLYNDYDEPSITYTVEPHQ